MPQSHDPALRRYQLLSALLFVALLVSLGWHVIDRPEARGGSAPLAAQPPAKTASDPAPSAPAAGSDAVAESPESTQASRPRTYVIGSAAARKDPKLATMRASARIDKEYGAFFKKQRLSEAETAALRKFLLDREMLGSDVTSAAAAQNVDMRTPEGKAAILNLYGQGKKEMEQTIAGTMGQQRFEELRAYERTIPDRNAINEFAQRLSGGADALDPAVIDGLIDLVSAEWANKKGRVVVLHNGVKMTALPETVAEKAAPLLTPRQREKLSEMVAQSRATVESAKAGGGVTKLKKS